MKYSVASVLAALLAMSAAHAQEGQPIAPDKPVEATEAPENEATDPVVDTSKLPLPDSGQAATATATSDGNAADDKWDVNAPRGAVLKQVPIRTDEGTWMDLDV